MDFSYYNSGLYLEPFFTKLCGLDFFSKNIYLFDEVQYDRELLIKYYEQELEYVNDEYEKLEKVDQLFWNVLSFRDIYYEPLIFDEEIALKCGLNPFKYKGIELLVSNSGAIELASKLDAYQLLTDGTIDPKSRIFTCSLARKYFENIVGEELTQKVLKD